MTDPEPNIRVTYIGARFPDGAKKLRHNYQRADGTTLAFERQLRGVHHRVGDVVELASPAPEQWKIVAKHEHVDSPIEEAEDIAARQLYNSDKAGRRAANKSDLEEAIEPLRRAYTRMHSAQRPGFIVWVVRTMSGWRTP